MAITLRAVSFPVPGFSSVAVLCFVLLYAPIVALVVYSFNSGTNIALWEGFSLQWYVVAWENELVQEVTFRSLFGGAGHDSLYGSTGNDTNPKLSRTNGDLCCHQSAIDGT